jgi:hypothetical protein
MLRKIIQASISQRRASIRKSFWDPFDDLCTPLLCSKERERRDLLLRVDRY